MDSHEPSTKRLLESLSVQQAVPKVRKLRQAGIQAFTMKVPKALDADEITQEEVEEIHLQRDELKEDQRRAAEEKVSYIKALTEKWGLPFPQQPKIRPQAFGRKSKQVKYTESLYDRIEKIAAGEEEEPENAPHLVCHEDNADDHPAALEDVAPSEALSPSRTVIPSDAAGDDQRCPFSSPDPSEVPLVPTNDMASCKEKKKNRRDLSLMLLFFDLQKTLRLTETETVEYVNNNLATLYNEGGTAPLAITTVRTWRKTTIPSKLKAAADREAKEAAKPKSKRGPKVRTMPVGTLPERNNRKLSHALLLEICNLVMALLGAGVPLSRPILIPQIVAVLELNNVVWRPSKAWYTRGLLKPMGLRWRRATHAHPAKPVDEEGMTRKFLMRVFYVVWTYNVPRNLFLNCDETGLNLLPTPDNTYAATGAKQVYILGKGDKRQYTLLFAISASGQFAGRFQLVWQNVPKQELQDTFKEDIFCSASPSHWSVPETIKVYITKLYDDYVLPTILDSGLDPARQNWVLLWDCYSVHRDADVRAWAKEKFPTLVLLFVPAGFTYLLQPLDVSVNRVLKALIANLFSKWLTANFKKQLQENVAVGNMKIDLTLTALKEPYMLWTQQAKKSIEGGDTACLRKGWTETGISNAWEDSKNRDLLRAAISEQEKGTLWTVEGGRKKDYAVSSPELETDVKAAEARPKQGRLDSVAVDNDSDEEAEAEEEHFQCMFDAMHDGEEDDEEEDLPKDDEGEELPEVLAEPVRTRAGRLTKKPVRLY